MPGYRFWLCLLIFCLAPLSLGFSPAQQAEDAAYWQGTMEIVITGPKLLGEGDLVTRYHLNVRWKEVNRIDVKDEDGNLTGQFVILGDAGSSWTGTTTGLLTLGEGCSYMEMAYAAEGAGSKTLEFGWIYYSLSENDPLASALPNGAYHLSGAQEEKNIGNMTHTFVICATDTTMTNSQPFEAFSIGWAQVGRYMAHPLGDPGPNGYSAEAYKANIESMAPMLEQNLAILDPEPRVLTDGMMQGRYFYEHFMTGDPTVDVTWDVRRIRDVRAILEEADEDWLPKGDTETNTTKIKARLEEGQKLEGKWRFTLFEVTQEPGYALNAGDEEDLDLEFEEGQAGFAAPVRTEDGWQIETAETADSATVIIRARDYGAWGKLKAEVNIDSVWYPAEAEGGGEYVTAPYDEDEDRIADSWENEYGVKDYDQNWDEDPEPSGQKSEGDGIALYEEYRGFVNENYRHERLHPKHKELFIRDEDGLAARASFDEVSGLKTFYIGDDGWTGNDPLGPGMTGSLDLRVINYNTSDYGHIVDQHALHVVMGEYLSIWPSNPMNEVFRDTLDILSGACYSSGSGPSSPAGCHHTAVFVDEIMRDMWQTVEDEAYFDPGKELSREEIEAAAIQDIIAITRHEMGHGVGVWHHSPHPSAGDPNCVMRYNYLEEMVWGIKAWPSILTEQTDCCIPQCRPACDCLWGESCWSQVQVSDKIE